MKTIEFTWEDDAGAEHVEQLPAKWEICGNCDGEGKHMNTSIRNHAYTPEEFDEAFPEDEDREMYFNGGYDESCEICNGAGKELVVNQGALKELNPELHTRWVEKQKQDACFEAENRAERAAECAAECAISGCYDDFYDGNY